MLSLRGNKGFMIDAEGLRYHIGKRMDKTLDNLVIPLMYIIKAGTGNIHHIKSHRQKDSFRGKG